MKTPILVALSFTLAFAFVLPARSVAGSASVAPEIASLSRAWDRREGGAEVVLEGSGFVGQVELFLGDDAVSELTVESATRIRFVVPPQRRYGARLLTLRTPAGTAQCQFSIRPPALSDIAVGEITTVAGGGIAYFADGQPAASPTANVAPWDVTVDAAGNVYVTEIARQRIRRIDAVTGRILTFAGTGAGGFSGDGGPAIVADLYIPSGVAVDRAGNLYVADTANGRVRRIDAITGVISTVAGSGSLFYEGDGRLATETGMEPRRIALDSEENLFVVSDRRVLRIDASTRIVTTVAGTGFLEHLPSGDGGPATEANLGNVQGVVVAPDGDLVIAAESRIRSVEATTGIISTIAGSDSQGFAGDGGPATEALLSFPTAVALDAEGNVFVADPSHGPRVRRIDAATGVITTFAGNGETGVSGDGGPATDARLWYPNGLAVTASGDVLVADSIGGRVRRIDASTGIITTIAGNERPLVGTGALAPGSEGALATDLPIYAAGVLEDPDGLLFATAGVFEVRAVDGVLSRVAGDYEHVPGELFASGFARDPAGNILVADEANDRIWRIDAETHAVSVVAGSGVEGFGGEGGPAIAATLNSPRAVACDGAGNVFIADSGNHRIRRVDAVTGIITTVAGKGVLGFGGDGRSALRARLHYPLGVAVDDRGTIYIADTGNNRIRRVRRGIIKTMAGSSAGFGGDGGPARRALLDSPFGIAVDRAGNVYVADFNNRRVRRIVPSTKTIETVAGGGGIGYPSDGGPATAATLYNPISISIDAEGNLLIADTGHLAVRCVKGVTPGP